MNCKMDIIYKVMSNYDWVLHVQKTKWVLKIEKKIVEDCKIHKFIEFSSSMKVFFVKRKGTDCDTVTVGVLDDTQDIIDTIRDPRFSVDSVSVSINNCNFMPCKNTNFMFMDITKSLPSDLLSKIFDTKTLYWACDNARPKCILVGDPSDKKKSDYIPDSNDYGKPYAIYQNTDFWIIVYIK